MLLTTTEYVKKTILKGKKKKFLIRAENKLTLLFNKMVVSKNRMILGYDDKELAYFAFPDMDTKADETLTVEFGEGFEFKTEITITFP